MVPEHNEGKYGDQRRSIFSLSSPTHPSYNKEDKDTPIWYPNLEASQGFTLTPLSHKFQPTHRTVTSNIRVRTSMREVPAEPG